jgi:hypothetical protein
MNTPRVVLAIVAAGAACCLSTARAQPDLPEVVVTADNTRIDRSCRVVVPEGTVIEDADGNGVIHIVASDIRVEFAEGSALLGAPSGTSWETLGGVGVRIDGQTNVTLVNPRVHFFKVGIHASGADGLEIRGADVSDGYAMRLGSTPEAEDGADWLWPHENDDHQWMNRYGAGIYVERSSGVTIRDTFARRTQNAIIIDRVTDSRIFDNDCSFLSGWGLAMWRSSRNVVSRNAFDFCVRGYSHGVYNRGQDSAGILVFEQCSDNLFAENSATHGGDGFFGFAGREALGQTPAPEGFSLERAGCNDNLLINNDFSYAPAHGIEMTFSFGNRYIGNRLVGNAICGVWGGYSQDTLIAGNLLEGNGEGAYGLERGGVNIEHGAGNVIRDNVFRNNKCGVHLWWDNDEGLLATDWAKTNHRGSTDNDIIRNRFEGDVLAFHLRETTETRIGGNEFVDVGRVLDATPGSEPEEVMVTMELFEPPAYEAFGETEPVGARAHLAGRENIIMGEYFPWDHASPLARRVRHKAGEHAYEVLGPIEDFYAVLNGETAQLRIIEPEDGSGDPYRVEVFGRAGVHPYKLSLRGEGFERVYEDTLVVAKWEATFFHWTADPREDLEGWRAHADEPDARTATVDALSFAYGHGGPKHQNISEAVTKAGPGGDRFGMIARTKLRLTPGRWRFTTLSDDGVRVTVDGEPVIENWTWHAPTRDTGELVVEQERVADIVVEHFEIDGYAVLELSIEPVTD